MYWQRVLAASRKVFITFSRRQLAVVFLRRHWPLLIALLVPLGILGPLLGRGFVLTYDMIFTPHVQLDLHAAADGRALYSALPLQALLKLVSVIVPVDIIQKIILYGIFFLAIYGMYRCLPLASRPARLVAGLLYAVNPMTYDRLMAGHWLFLLAYSLTPFVFGAFYRLFTQLNRHWLIRSIILWSLTAMISPHHLVILGLLFITMAVALVRSKRALYYGLAVIAGVGIVSSWWILPISLIPNFTHAFTLGDFTTFASKPDLQYGIWLTLISLRGFWYTSWNNLKDIYPFWPFLALLWLVPVWIGLGMLRTIRVAERHLIVSLLILSFAVILFAAGPNAEFASVNNWLFLHVPGLSGLREPQKLLALLALFYAVAAAYGIDSLARLHFKRLAYLLSGLAASLIVIVSWPIFWGAHGQLHATTYPAAWQTAYTFLERQPTNERALVLPYELYLNKTFAGRLVANPASAYFGSRVLTSDDPKLPGMQSFATPEASALSAVLERHDQAALSHVLTQLGIHYIVFITSSDTAAYDWVIQLPHTQIIRSNELMIIQLTPA